MADYITVKNHCVHAPLRKKLCSRTSCFEDSGLRVDWCGIAFFLFFAFLFCVFCCELCQGRQFCKSNLLFRTALSDISPSSGHGVSPWLISVSNWSQTSDTMDITESTKRFKNATKHTFPFPSSSEDNSSTPHRQIPPERPGTIKPLLTVCWIIRFTAGIVSELREKQQQ